MEAKKLKIGITQGDINGIGYEVIIKTLEDNRILDFCIPIVYGSPKVAAYHRKSLDINASFSIVNSASEAAPNKLSVVNCSDDEVKVEFSKADPEAGKAALDALERAIEEYKQGLIDVIVTAPINKHTIQSETFDFPGHTEYIERKLGNGAKSLMILMKDDFRVALVTGHIPVSQIASTITKDLIKEKIAIFNKSLKQDFGIGRPRIAVLSLNPHAGDDGLLGKEEQEIISPALQEMNDEGVICYGPYAADGFMGSENYMRFDGILAMYHDQGLAPFKALAMDEGVNYTAGLPVIRTSPAHGTAYDIAGQGIARYTGLLGYCVRYTWAFLKADGLHTNPKVLARGLWRLFGWNGIVSGVIPDYLQYFRPSFHPWQEDNSSMIARWKEILPQPSNAAAIAAATTRCGSGLGERRAIFSEMVPSNRVTCWGR